MAKKGNRKQAGCNYFLGNKQIIEPKKARLMGYLVDKVYEVLIRVLICKQKDLVWGCKEGKERKFLGLV